MAKIRTLSEVTTKEVQDLLRYERQRSKYGVGDYTPFADADGDRIVRWCRTTTNSDHATYPTDVASTKFVAEFGDYQWDNTTVGVETPTFEPYTDPAYERIVISHVGYIAEETVVRATLHHGRWHILSESGTTCHTVRFQIVSADPTTRTALGEVMARPVGCTDVPESMLGGTVIDICDPQGCFFNEPNEALTDRQGWARYMQPVTENICQPDLNYLVPQWEVFSLCCAIPDCDVA